MRYFFNEKKLSCYFTSRNQLRNDQLKFYSVFKGSISECTENDIIGKLKELLPVTVTKVSIIYIQRCQVSVTAISNQSKSYP